MGLLAGIPFAKNSSGTSTGNSTTAALGGSATFTGAWENVEAYVVVSASVSYEPTNASGTFYYEFSSDGATAAISFPVTVTGGEMLPSHRPVSLPYFRVRYVNDATATTSFRITTLYHRVTPISTLQVNDAEITSSNPLPAVTAGVQPDGTFSNMRAAGVDANNSTDTPLTNVGPVVFTADNTTDTLTSTSHGMVDDDAVSFLTTDTLPAGLSAGTVYFVINATSDTFQVSDEIGGLAIDFTDDGIGTHTFLHYNVVADNTTDILTLASHGLSDNDRISLETADTMPTGLNADTFYYVVSATGSTFQVSLTQGGSAVDFTDDGTGNLAFIKHGVFTGTWFEWSTGGFVGLFSSNTSDQPGTLVINLSTIENPTDSSDVDVADSIKVPYNPDEDKVLRRYIPYQSRWYRIQYVNGDVDQSELDLQTSLLTGPPSLGMQKVTELPQPNNLAALVRSISTGQKPDGTFADIKADGVLSDNSSSELLPANTSFTGEWNEITGYNSISVFIRSDQVSASNGIELQFADDVLGTNIVSTVLRSYDTANIGVKFITSPRTEFIRVKYTNGSNGQNFFYLQTEINARNVELPQAPYSTDVGSNFNALMTRGSIVAPDSTDTWGEIQRADNSGGLETAIVEHEVTTPIRGLSSMSTSQANIGTTATQVAGTPITNRKAIAIKNHDADNNVFLGTTSAVTTSTGFLISPLETVELNIDESVPTWLVTEDSGATTNQQVRSGADTSTSSGVVNPDNALSSNDTYADLDDTNDVLEITGYSSQQVEAEIQTILLGFEGFKEQGQDETIAHQETQTTINSTASTSIVSPTVQGVAGHFYLAAISLDTITETVNTVTGLGLTWSLVRPALDGQGGSTRLYLFKGEGTPTGNGTITVNYSASVGDSVMSVHRFSGVNLSTPIQNIATNISGPSETSVYSTSITASIDDVIFSVVSQENRSHTAGATYTERADISTGAGGGQAGLAVQTKTVTSGGSNTVDGTLSGNADWGVIAINLKQSPAENPQVTLSYEVSAVAGATTLSQTLSNSTDQSFEVDITGDRAWVFADVDNLTAIITADSVDAAAAKIDHLYLDITEVSAGGLVRISVLQLGSDL